MVDGTTLLGERRTIDRTGLWQIYTRTLFGSFSAANAYVLDPANYTYDSATLVGARGRGDEAGNWIVECLYEKADDAGSANIDDGLGLVEEISFAREQDPISSNPNFAAIKAKYGWIWPPGEFPQNTTSGSAAALPGASGNRMQISPVYGTASYLSFTCTYRQTKMTIVQPDGLFNGLGAIDDNVPFQRIADPAANDDRDWIYLGPRLATRGVHILTCKEWRLSGPGGAIRPVYSAAALSVRLLKDN